MRVRRSALLEGARAATGHVVIVDVYRAFTTAAFCIAAGAREVVLVATVEEARRLARPPEVTGAPRRDPGRGPPDQAPHLAPFLTGEVDGRPIDGFDAGNSPSAISSLDLAGRRVIQRTSSGTQGVVAATGAREILLGSFVIASATCRYLAARADLVTVVAMGEAGLRPAEEDEACAAYLASLLLGLPVTPPPAPLLRTGWDDRGWPDWFPRRDAELACDVDRFDFALPVSREDGMLIARPFRE